MRALNLLVGALLVATLSREVPGAESKSIRRSLRVTPDSKREIGFTLLSPAATGIVFTNRLSDAAAAQNQIRYNGSGVALGDVDNDGWCDIYLCGQESGNVLYKNLGGLRFTNVTAVAGVACDDQFSTGAVLADVDGDNDLDLLVNGIATGSRLFLNDGSGKFSEAQNSGLARRYGAMSAAFGDVDGDGLLDLYVANYRAATVRSSGFALIRRGNQSFVRPEDRDQLEITDEGRVLEKGEPHILYHNQGGGRFAAFSWTKGLFRDENNEPLREAPRDWGLSVMFRDLNGDGLPDLYVCNDFYSPDRIWINQGRWTFRAMSHDAIKATSTFSMTVDVADINRDGYDDVFVGDMLRRGHLGQALAESAGPSLTRPAGAKEERQQLLRNTLQLNRGDGTFAEISQFAGLDASDWTWSAIFCDVDLDGYEDLLCATGQMFDTQDLDADARIGAMGPWPREKIPQKVLQYPRLPMKNLAFRNRGDLKFEEVGHAWGFDFNGVSNGMALADLDNDGDMDVVVNNLNDVAQIYRNENAAPRVAVRLRGNPPNTRGIGGRIVVSGGAVPVQTQEIICGGRYLSADDTMRTFAAGAATNTLTVEVTWRSGKRTVVEQVQPNTLIEVSESDAEPFSRPPRPPRSSLFTDVSHLLQHTNTDLEFDDLARQPMLPHKLSHLGPGVTWADINNDGKEDLVIGSGRGGSTRIFVNDGRKLSPLPTAVFEKAADDQTTVLSWKTGADESMMVVGESNYESGATNSSRVYRFRNGSPDLRVSLSLGESSSGPIAAADVDGDGDLDLFVGARVVPGRYPQPAVSRFFVNGTNGFSAGQEISGLVSGAVFSDLDGDGWPELIIASDWGPLRIFKKVRDKFVEENFGLEKYSGWWNGVTTGDFDGDGKLDIIATNMGENSKYERFQPPIRLHYGNWSGEANLELLESCWSKALGQEVPIRGLDLLKRGAPDLAQKFASYAAYGAVGVPEILPANRLTVEVNSFATTIFLNRGKRFEPVALPVEAQWAPGFGVSVGDVDGDGVEDIFIAQNFTDLGNDTFWSASGRGLLLRGLGDGRFKSDSAQESGIAINGDGRGSAFCDYDGDGRLDLAVAQNRGETRLFQNTKATPGVRVRLRGPAGNVQGVGAVARMKRNDKLGPAREIKLGSGYWSQESIVLIFPRGDELHTLWPGGKRTVTRIPPSATEVVIDF